MVWASPTTAPPPPESVWVPPLRDKPSESMCMSGTLQTPRQDLPALGDSPTAYSVLLSSTGQEAGHPACECSGRALGPGRLRPEAFVVFGTHGWGMETPARLPGGRGAEPVKIPSIFRPKNHTIFWGPKSTCEPPPHRLVWMDYGRRISNQQNLGVHAKHCPASIANSEYDDCYSTEAGL